MTSDVFIECSVGILWVLTFFGVMLGVSFLVLRAGFMRCYVGFMSLSFWSFDPDLYDNMLVGWYFEPDLCDAVCFMSMSVWSFKPDFCDAVYFMSPSVWSFEPDLCDAMLVSCH